MPPSRLPLASQWLVDDPRPRASPSTAPRAGGGALRGGNHNDMWEPWDSSDSDTEESAITYAIGKAQSCERPERTIIAEVMFEAYARDPRFTTTVGACGVCLSSQLSFAFLPSLHRNARGSRLPRFARAVVVRIGAGGCGCTMLHAPDPFLGNAMFVQIPHRLRRHAPGTQTPVCVRPACPHLDRGLIPAPSRLRLDMVYRPGTHSIGPGLEPIEKMRCT